jgi:hypothetical protein
VVRIPDPLLELTNVHLGLLVLSLLHLPSIRFVQPDPESLRSCLVC